METQSLPDLFVDELRDMLHAEHQILKALPKLAKSARSPELQSAFNEHLEQTKGQVQRLEQVFDQFGVPARGKKCRGMEGILEEGKEMMQKGDGAVLDAMLVAGAQKVEHYEIASYGTLRTYARLLGNEEAARLLEQTLEEEKRTDEKLTALANEGINLQAMQAGAPQS